MRTRNRIRSVVAMAMAFLMVFAGTALADDPVADGDVLTEGVQTLALGNVCLNATKTASVDHWVTRAGNGQVYANSASVAITHGTVPSRLSVTLPSDSIPLPNNWETVSNNTPSAKVRSTVTFTAGPTTGTFNASIPFTAAGKGRDVATLTRTNSLAVTASVVNCQAATSISAVSGSGTFGGTATLTATLQAGSAGVASKSVAFSINSSVVGSASTDSSGVATLSNVSLTGIGAGNHAVSASFAGDSSHLASNGSGMLAVSKATTTTTVTCDGGPFTYNGSAHEPCSVSVTGAGGLNLTPDPQYANNVNAGTATASYTYGGSDNHLGSSDSKPFTIANATPTVSIDWSDSTYDGSANAATASVTGVGGANLGSADLTYYSGTTASGTPLAGAPTNADTYTVKAEYAGSANYNRASATKTITINKAATTTTVTCPATVTYTGSALEPCTAKVTGPRLDQSLTVSYQNNTNVGTATASASYVGGDNHLTSNGSASFSVQHSTTGVLEPINQDGSSKFKLNSTIPVKIKLTGASAGISNAVITQSVSKLSNNVWGDELEGASTATPHSGNQLRYDASSDQYIFNLATKPLGTGTFRITLNLGGGKTETAQFSIVK